MPSIRLDPSQVKALNASKARLREARMEAEKMKRLKIPGWEESMAIIEEAERLRDVLLQNYGPHLKEVE